MQVGQIYISVAYVFSHRPLPVQRKRQSFQNRGIFVTIEDGGPGGLGDLLEFLRFFGAGVALALTSRLPST